MKKNRLFFVLLVVGLVTAGCANKKLSSKSNISSETLVSPVLMEQIYSEIKTPFKYGVVFKHPDSTKLMDSPTIFRDNDIWYMTYIVFDGNGYETWIAESNDLTHWISKGKILSFSDNSWDANQKAGYMSLVDINWGGEYGVEKFQDKYWMSYLGGKTKGYESGVLGVGIANSTMLTGVQEWNRLNGPVLNPTDAQAQWFDNKVIYKSSIIHDTEKHTGHSFIMYYNAKGVTADYESIAMAVSDDMVNWKRLGTKPVITKYKGICGDAQIAKINGMYVMFYFGAFWKPGAFERFACSYDLVNWTDWSGEDLVSSSEPFDETYAHKPWVIKWNGTVYHFYNAVGKQGRVIALATSKDLSK